MLKGTALVLGATGNVGYGISAALLEAGVRVVAPSRDEQRANALREQFEGESFAAIVGDPSSDDGAEALAAASETAHGPIDHVVASIGPWWQKGRLSEQPKGEWDRVRSMLLDGHVHLARALMPRLALRPSATYTIVTGMGAHHHTPGTSMLYVACGAVLSLSQVLRDEHRSGPVRVNELLIGARIEREARDGVVPAAELGAWLVDRLAAEPRSEVLRFPAANGRA
ncbi:SDR family NAD(P)-dependent oxidoreductase [Haliangium ochraceum]|uniref:Short-chain dehydrogenase/reductase SDR n=1 Tax=Haliangium ochraceum (strain DSM 14365 / JCM 11303 / SMP-2) TaxID=502025 RepID=D0LX22_HALO1|nr:SDR family oxidoreductase [Haliangium ochraceum]ACY14269.1 short-chain dehydrogenase/reductase SDR [Haliangium ochraceum DSM 14365]